MSTTKERNRIAEKITGEIIPACCNGDQAAEAYLKRVFYVVRVMDDYYDGDVKIEKEDMARIIFILIGELPHNSFYKEHADTLTALHIVGFNAWQDANKWEKEDDELKKMYAHVIRDFICELFAMVAFLTGGQKSMKETSLKVREFFLKEMGE